MPSNTAPEHTTTLVRATWPRPRIIWGIRNIQNTMIYVDITNRRRDELAERNHDWK
jgi:hypothetical protein